MPIQTLSHHALRSQSETLAAGFPALLTEAERVAAIVAQGTHGRRRAGQGETFWQYRNYHSSDSATQIDWRRSARGDQVFVRDNEWEAANTVYIWRDGSPGMAWQSSNKFVPKIHRASVLSLALVSLLMRAGERAALLGESDRIFSGQLGLERFGQSLARASGTTDKLNGKIAAHAKLVLVSDFLEPAEVWQQRLSRLSGRPVSGVLLRIADPAEAAFPYKGRVEMRLPGRLQMPPFLLGRAEKAREAYQEKYVAHRAAISQTASRLGWTVIDHTTDQPATLALSALYQALAGEM